MNEHYINIKDIAHLKGLKSTRSIRIAIQKGKYVAREVKVNGGTSYEILYSSLESEIQEKLEDETIKSTALIPVENKMNFISENARLNALARVDIITALFNLRTKYKTKKEADAIFLDLYNSGLYLPQIYKFVGKISIGTLYRWVKAYENYGTNGLLPRRKTSPQNEYNTILNNEMKQIFLKYLLHSNHFSIGKAINLTKHVLEKRGFKDIPCNLTFRRFAKHFKKTNYSKWVLMREGEKAYHDKVEAYIERDISKLEVGDVLIADGHVLNFQVINPFTGKPTRATLVGFLDWKSTALVGYEIMMTENTQCIASALRNSILNLGLIPKVVYQDNGKAFKAKYFQHTDFDEAGFNGVYSNLGIKSVFAKPYNYFDCILANPPFMTPKGGIQPHNKFGVKANRSEVLFVDYIMEHLNSTGRAGVIVPEGIVFQSANAYKDLRKKLVEEKYLYAVVSLPSGIFQPYSGVKTSILFMDRQLAKKTDKVLFVEIQNDGFDLGAQRRSIDKNDLPKALEVINQWQNSINAQTDFITDSKMITLVEKSKLAENGEYNLTASRYKEAQDFSNCKWDMVKLENLFLEIKNGKNVEQFEEKGKYRVSRIQTIANGVIDIEKTKWTNDEVNSADFLQDGDILLSHINSFEHLAKTAIFKLEEKIIHGVNLIKFRADKTKINPLYAIYIFKSTLFINKAKSFAQRAVNQASIKVADLKTIEIPLPPLELQEEIVKELDGYQAVIDGAQKVIDNWKPTIPSNQNWKTYNIEEIAEFISGVTIAIKDNVA